MRWDLIEKYEVLRKGDCSRARKVFSGKEDFFSEHFPGRPLVPETLMIEMIAQAGGVLFGLGVDFKTNVILAKIEKARFLEPVSPPCELVVEAAIEKEREEGAWISGVIKQGNRVVAEAEILLVVMDSLEDGQKKQVVFNKQFLKHYDIYQVARVSEA